MLDLSPNNSSTHHWAFCASREAAIHTLQRNPKLASTPLLKTKLTEFGKTLHRE
jgi:hypothetical protein